SPRAALSSRRTRVDAAHAQGLECFDGFAQYFDQDQRVGDRAGARRARAQAGVAHRAYAGVARRQRSASAGPGRGERPKSCARRTRHRSARAPRRPAFAPARSCGMTTRSQASGERMVTLDVSLLGRDFKVACKEAERAELTDAVALLDRRMREI